MWRPVDLINQTCSCTIKKHASIQLGNENVSTINILQEILINTKFGCNNYFLHSKNSMCKAGMYEVCIENIPADAVADL